MNKLTLSNFYMDPGNINLFIIYLQKGCLRRKLGTRLQRAVRAR